MTKNNTGIYELTFTDVSGNAKTYIGASANLKSRAYHHKRELHLGKSHVTALQSEFTQSASSNSAISFEVLEYCDHDQLKAREAFHISERGSDYNVNAAGGGVRVVGDGFREKMRKRLIGRQMRFDGIFVTPFGEFQSSYRAASASPVAFSQFALLKACKSPDTVITRLAYAKSRYLKATFDESIIGKKSWGDIGFDFRPKAEDDTGIKDQRSDIGKMCLEMEEGLAELKDATTDLNSVIQASKRRLN